MTGLPLPFSADDVTQVALIKDPSTSRVCGSRDQNKNKMSTSSVLAMLLLIGLTSSISSVAGLQCWRCHTDGTTCADSNKETTCTPEFPTCERRFKSDKKMYSRGCSQETELGCRDMGGVYKGENWCICNTDLCNGDRDGSGGASRGHLRWTLLITGFALLTYFQ